MNSLKRVAITLVLLFDGFMFAQDKAPEPYHIKGDILGEPILTYRRNNPECAEKDSLDGLANFYHANNSAKFGQRRVQHSAQRVQRRPGFIFLDLFDGRSSEAAASAQN